MKAFSRDRTTASANVDPVHQYEGEEDTELSLGDVLEVALRL